MELLMKGCEMLDLGKGLREMRIECRQGRCWRPHAGDSCDHILGAAMGIQGLRRRNDRLNDLRDHCDWNCLSRRTQSPAMATQTVASTRGTAKPS